MKFSRTGQLAGLVVAGAVALTACGSNNNTTTTPAASGSASSSGTASGGISCATGTITGAGSTAQQNAMAEWTKQYQSSCNGATINYQGVGSGAGIQQFIAGTVDFAGSDSSLSAAEATKAAARCGGGSQAINLPMVVGPVGIAYNLPGVNSLVLDAPTLAKIFQGQITKWDDAAIKKLNPSASLPGTGIQTFHRSDASGTTDNFTAYLAAASGGAWTAKPGKDWTAPGGQGAKGSDGVAAGVKQTAGGIGYMELSFISNLGLKAIDLDTGSGTPVKLDATAAGKAVETAKLKGTGNDLALQIDYATKTAGVYPLVLVTYEIVCEKGTAAGKLNLVKSFLTYTSSSAGQQAISNAGYAPLPQSFITKVKTVVSGLS